MSTLTKIVSLAKKLKKQAPKKFAKWTDYIKEASTKVKPVVKKAKKVAKKVTKKVKKTYKKHLGETHTDTNSHNVKLSFYSGAGLRKNENTLSYAKPIKNKYNIHNNPIAFQKSYKKTIKYKNILIDVLQNPVFTDNNKLFLPDIEPFLYFNNLKLAKNYIDRYILKNKLK